MNFIILCGTLAFLASPVPKSASAELRKQMEAHLADLSGHGRMSHRAILKLAHSPQAAVSVISGKLKPVRLERERALQLLKDLGSEEESVWKPAFVTFRYFDPRLAYDLKDLFDESPNLIARMRLAAVCLQYPATSDVFENGVFSTKVIDDTYFEVTLKRPGSSSGWTLHRTTKGLITSEWSKAEIALELLEHIGTSESIAVIKSMATGHPDAGPTIAAKEALKRWEGK